MEIKTPRIFKTSDKAHAELFNNMVKVILKMMLDYWTKSINTK